MPGFPDKIIINHGGGRGVDKLIDEDMQSLSFLADELIQLEKAGKLPLKDTLDLRDRLKKACDVHYDAEMAYHNELRELIEETRQRIDKALGL